MRKIIVLCLALWANFAAAESWSGDDKQIHFLGSAMVAVVVTAATDSPWIGFWSVLALGVTKEVIDQRRGGRASGRDLVADVAGAYIGSQAGRLLISRRGDTTAVVYALRF